MDLLFAALAWLFAEYPLIIYGLLGSGIAAVILVRRFDRGANWPTDARRRNTPVRRAEPDRPPTLSEPPPSLAGSLQDLVILRLELKRMAAAGELDAEQYRRFSEAIDEQWTTGLATVRSASDLWRQRCMTAWRILIAHGRVPEGPPPWVEHPVEPRRLPPLEWVAPTVKTPVAEPTPAPPPAPIAPSLTKTTQPPRVAKDDHEAPAPVTPPVPEQITPALEEAATGAGYAWHATEPGALEKALRAVSGWPRSILPFLVQNIGWFIGGFCFLAGSIFLVAYTGGLARGIVVFAALFTYTGFLLWAGYRMRRRQPALTAASDMLLTLGLLLAPLTISAAVRLMLAGPGWMPPVIGLAAALLAFAVFGFAAQVVAGVTDRALQGTHPLLYMALAATQLAVPLLARWPAWPLLALLHGLLLALLGYGLARYAHDWMRAIFVERRKIAYFAGGTLLYAALISFVHLTWAAPSLNLPTGYYAPYLMAVCGLLFHVDAHFKTWAHEHVFLSRFSFLVYGLSVLAVVLAADAPHARLLTLALGAVIYGVVAWRYLSLTPVYLLLASLAGLYGALVLDRFPPDQHFLWSLPGLAGLWALHRGLRQLAAERAGAFAMNLLVYRVLVWAAVALGGWSLSQARPGWIATLSALVLAGGLWVWLGAAPGSLLGPLQRDEAELRGSGRDLRDSPWLYLFTLAVTAAAAFAPPWIGLDWPLRFAFALMLLAWAWTGAALIVPRMTERLARKEVFANSALLSVAVGLLLGGGIGALDSVQGVWSVPLFAGAALTLLALSLGLYLQPLFYGFLLMAGAAAILGKLHFFPGPTTGVQLMVMGLLVWGLSWWLDRQPDEAVALRRARLEQPLTLLWWFRRG